MRSRHAGVIGQLVDPTTRNQRSANLAWMIVMMSFSRLVVSLLPSHDVVDEFAGFTLITPMSALIKCPICAPPAEPTIYSARLRASFAAAASISILSSPSLV